MQINQNIKIAVDTVVFGYKKGTLYLLLIENNFGTLEKKWALPGGLVHENEPLIDAAKRELFEETNMQLNHLEQLYTFGDNVNRDNRNRVISVAYFGLVNTDDFEIYAQTDAENVKWTSINEIPTLAFDHADIVQMALQRLQTKLTYQPIGFNLLPKYFLFSDLESLYSSILQTTIDRRNFRKKLLSLNFIDETDKISESKTGRPAKFFTFNKLKYTELEKQKIHLDIKFV